MNGGWLTFIVGVVIAIVISTVQRRYPSISFAGLLGVSLGCAALFRVALFIVHRSRKRS